jgi:peptidoglycan hydrolase-like protein with peptidoglycan-binding domain
MVAVGVGAAALTLIPAVPTALATAAPATKVAASPQTFSDERRVELAVTRAPETTVTVPMAGRITASRCGVEPFSSGTSSLSVNSQAVVSLATRVPLWRDLSVGDKGEDVVALQSELARLGHAVKADGSVGAATLAAVASLIANAGETGYRSQTVPASRLLWIPEPTAMPESCALSVGSAVEAGGVLATFSGAITALSVVQLPDGTMPGERVLEVDGHSVPVGPDGTVTDAASLAGLAATPALRAPRKSEEAATIAAMYRLAEPVSVSAVPPSAVYAVADAKGCVLSAKGSVPVVVVGSQLGETFVRTEAGEPLGIVEVSPAKRPPCR